MPFVKDTLLFAAPQPSGGEQVEEALVKVGFAASLILMKRKWLCECSHSQRILY